MKKITALVLASLCLFTLSGCSSDNEAADTADNSVQYDWGITLKAENVTSSGLTLVCSQSGGENVAQLETGSFFVVQKKNKSKWKDVDYIVKEDEFGWTMEAWEIPKENTSKWDVNWEWLYGKLRSGDYRIGKKFTNFRGTGDFDNMIIYTDFSIE